MIDGTIFGMNIHHMAYPSYQTAELERNLKLCKDLGCNLIRFNWNFHTNSDYDYIETVLSACENLNLKTMHVSDNRDMFVDENCDEAFYYKRYFDLAKHFGTRIDYYQIFNELDVAAMHTDEGSIYKAGDGKVFEEYDPKRLQKIVPAVRGAIKGIRDGCPKAKICLNFAWWHTYMLEYLDNNGCKWDITGIDWYSDAESKSSINDVISWLENRFPNRESIICEVNWWFNGQPTDKNEQEKLQAEFIPKFIDTVCDRNDKLVKGIIFYELLDEPAREHGSYCGEAHFGFYSCDRDGKNIEPKPVCDILKKKWG